jgi:rfaE bifunctional protein nucleotidyltransferase chain/domain
VADVITVLANGCFDLLHAGHVRHLQEARSMGDRLVVSLTLDDFVAKGAGRPVYRFTDRWLMLSALSCVDMVIGVTSLAAAIRIVRPHVIAKGVDWKEIGLFPEDLAAAREVGAEIRFTRAAKMSTTETIERIRCASA